MTSLTGPAETWLMETHTSFDGLEQFDRGVSSRGRNSGGDESRSMVAFYRHWWSYRPDEAVQALRKARYFQVSLYRTGIGSEAERSVVDRVELDEVSRDPPRAFVVLVRELSPRRDEAP